MQFFIGFRVIIKRIKAIRFMMKDPAVGKGKKALIIAGLVYLFLPLDIIPPVLFPIAWVDDLILWIWILFYLRETLDRYWMGEKEQDFKEKYKDAIEDVEFEVEEEEEEDESK